MWEGEGSREEGVEEANYAEFCILMHCKVIKKMLESWRGGVSAAT